MVLVKGRRVTWRHFMDLLASQKSWMLEAVSEFDLTPQMAHALYEIPEKGSLTMSELAEKMACDASNTTGIIDRLEARRLVERQPAKHDRRVKCVVLTATGKRLRRRIERRFDDVPPALAALSEEDQRRLGEILERALAHANEQRARRIEGSRDVVA
jgi:DNA-binding MarR family transcriptional regulator